MTKTPTVKPPKEVKAPKEKAATPAVTPTTQAPETTKAATPPVTPETKTTEDTPVKKKADKEQQAVGYTYVGGGEDSPRIINFMGKQRFVRGELTPVTDPEVLAKIEGASTFVKGEATQEQLHRIDEEAKEEADRQRAESAAIDKRFKKLHAGE